MFESDPLRSEAMTFLDEVTEDVLEAEGMETYVADAGYYFKTLAVQEVGKDGFFKFRSTISKQFRSTGSIYNYTYLRSQKHLSSILYTSFHFYCVNISYAQPSTRRSVSVSKLVLTQPETLKLCT